MRRLVAAILCLLPLTAFGQWTALASDKKSELPENSSLIEFEVRNGTKAVRGYAVKFNSKDATLRIVDESHNSSESLSKQLSDAGAFAGVNGSYFHGDFRPIGIVITDGKKVHDFERAKLLSGLLYADHKGIHLVRSSAFSEHDKIHAAIQAGPFLVADGEPVAGLNAERPAKRTAVLTDGRGNWALVYLSYVTLADAGEILALPGLIGGMKPATALNLDGGSSSAIWADTKPNSFRLSPFGSVRNLVGVAPR